ncbi:MAG: DUF5063 domain-containing protein [Sphingobacteriales bacterium]|nr:DUF5063 domain-containing protein [Sphingobacteriales bacterium]MBI3718781.1 DUF5063 domain-containing protein [Sphingobacteriales bacterium]
MAVDKINQTNSFNEFVKTIEAYCQLIESAQSDNYRNFLTATRKLLLHLYTYSIELPEFELPEKESEKIDITDNDIKNILSFIYAKIIDSYYWIVFNPTNYNDTEPSCGDLVDDLGDIYKDLKTFLHGFNNPSEEVKQNALWHLHWSFNHHWNDHCINAIYAIHYFINKDK